MRTTCADHFPGEPAPCPAPPDDEHVWTLLATSAIVLRSFLTKLGPADDEWAHQFEVRIYWTWQEMP